MRAIFRTTRSLLFAISLTVPLAAAALLPAARAQGIESIGVFGDWSVFRFNEDGNPACYMSSEPTKATGDYKKRGEVYAIVTHRPAEKRIGEVSIIAGYSYKKESAVEVTIGGQGFELFTQDDGAWAPDGAGDKKLVQAMRKGNRMVVKGTSSRGTLTTDTYSLKGFTKAYRAIGKACGL
jgi:invasion protein IalB